MEVYYKGMKSNRKTPKRLYLDQVMHCHRSRLTFNRYVFNFSCLVYLGIPEMKRATTMKNI